MSSIQQSRPSDIDRSLAIFYHPLFQEITSQWTMALFKKNQPDIDSNYNHSQDFQMNFLEFIEFNLKVQKCLLPQFDLSNAFVSALNDWVKEITECFNYSDLYSSNEKDIISIKQEIERTNKESLTLPAEEYLQFIDMFKEHEAFKIVKFHITNEVFCKFLFDLCTTWCEYLDIEMFVLFLFSVFLQISHGEEGIKDSIMKNTLQISNLKFEFFEEFERQKDIYTKQKKKNLRYYRAWCEWNYLRLNEMGESVILKLSQIFGEEEEDRIYDLVSIFEKAIDTINSEITSQMGKMHPSSLDNNNSLSKAAYLSRIKGGQKQQNSFQNEKNQKLNSDINNTNIKDMNQLEQDQFEQIGESKDLIRQKLNQIQQKDSISKQISQQQQLLKYNQIIQDQPDQQQQNLSKQQCFEIDYDHKGNIVMKKIVKIPILGKHIDPQPKDNLDQQKNYLKNQGDILSAQNYQIDTSYIQKQQKRNSSTKLHRILNNNQPNSQYSSSFQREQSPYKQQFNSYNNNNNKSQEKQNQYHPIALSSRGSSRQKSLRNSFIAQTKENNQNSQLTIETAKKMYQNPLLEKEQLKLQNQTQKEMNKTFQKEAIETHIKKGQSLQQNNNTLLESPKSNRLSPRIKDFKINKRVSPGRIENNNNNNTFQNHDLNIYSQQQIEQSDISQIELHGQNISNSKTYKRENNQLQIKIMQESIEQKNREQQEKLKEREDKIKNELIQFNQQLQLTSPQFDPSDNSVLVPEFLRNIKSKMIEQEQLNKNLNIFDKELFNINKSDLLNEFSNSLYQTKRNPQLDIAKKVLNHPNNVGKDELRQKVNKSFDKGNGRISYINQILEPNYTINVLPRPIKKNKQNQSKGERLLASPSKRFNQRDYQYEIILDDELNKIKEKSILDIQNQENNDGVQKQPNQNIDYKRAVDRYKNVWKKYLSEQDMYMLNDWDSLYKIIIILKRKFSSDHRQNYLNFLNLDLAYSKDSSSQLLDVDDTSTQASGEHETRFVLDKEKFKQNIEKLLKRDERRKKRRRNRRKLKQSSGNTSSIVAYDIFKEKRKKFIMTKFRSKSNKQLFKDVFLLPQITQ